MAVTWQNPISTYFTATDVTHMKQVANIDLSSYQDVKQNGEMIYAMVSKKRMPPGNPWQAEWITNFSAWMAAGYPES